MASTSSSRSDSPAGETDGRCSTTIQRPTGCAKLTAWCSFLADGAYGAAAALGVQLSTDVLEQATLACAEHGRTLTALDMYAAERTFNTTTRAVAGFFTTYDLLLTPTMASPNIAIGQLNQNDPNMDAQGWYEGIFTFALSNVTGAPSISIPGTPSPEGWPVGVQFLGRYGDEETLLGIAAFLEEATPWADRRPQVLAR